MDVALPAAPGPAAASAAAARLHVSPRCGMRTMLAALPTARDGRRAIDAAVRPHALLLALAAALVLHGCGYKLVRYGGGGDAEKTVAVVTLENGSQEPGVELLVSEALREEVVRRGAVGLVERPSDADYVLRGRVRPLFIQSSTISSIVLALEYTVTMVIDLAIVPAEGEPIRIDPRSLQGTEIYLASDDFQLARKNREEALRRLSAEIAARVHDVLDEELAP